jgi:hypothetical protein
VAIVNPTGTIVNSLSIVPVEPGLPGGSVASAGAISYTISEVTPGSSIAVTIQLPAGANPTAVFKLVDGVYTEYPSDLTTINGNQVTIQITDNGPFDSDPTPGVISDPLVIVEPPRPSCTTNTGTVKLSPGLTNTPAIQTMKIKGTLTGCTGEPFTAVAYSATLKTAAAVSCSVLKGAGETASGSSSYKWTPKTKPSTGTLNMLLTETPGVAFSGEVTSGPYAPLTLLGTATESYTGGPTCGEKVGKKAAKAVKKGTFSGSAVSFN